MCAHAPAAADITLYLTEQLYPAMSSQLDLVRARYAEPSSKATQPLLADIFYNLKKEFESLRNYESKLVFPSVLRVFNTRELAEQDQPKVNIDELQRLTQNKERLIADWITELERQAVACHLQTDESLQQLLVQFKIDFTEKKRVWHGMLNSWRTGCACFAAANAANRPPAPDLK